MLFFFSFLLHNRDISNCWKWKLKVVCCGGFVWFFFLFFLSFIIKHHVWEPSYLNGIKYSETWKKSVLAVGEVFETSSSLSSIAWLLRELFCISVALSSILVTLVLFQSPAHIPEVSWTFLAPSRVPWLLAHVKPGCGWLDIEHVLISGLVCINRLFSQQAKQNTY